MSAEEEREELIVWLSWWAGWCTEHDTELPQLVLLSGLLLDAKHQIAMDRPTRETDE
jgi:hypothetical protein